MYKKEKENCWYCPNCDFYVFNSKSQCKKCSESKPVNSSKSINKINQYYRAELGVFEKNLNEYGKKKYMESKTSCGRCRSEGRTYNCEPMVSYHNCWKYS